MASDWLTPAATDTGSRAQAWLMVIALCGCHAVAGLDDYELAPGAGGGGAAGGSCDGFTQDVTISADTSVGSASLFPESADAPSLSVSRGRSAQVEFRALLTFDPPTPPADLTLDGAELCLTHYANVLAEGVGFVSVHPLAGEWSEAGLEWDQTPAEDEAIDSQMVDGGSPAGTGVCWDVSTFVAKLLAGSPNHGVIPMPPDLAFLAVFHASESENTESRPVVALSWCPAVD